MDVKGQFDLYDIFAYLLPGAVIIFAFTSIVESVTDNDSLVAFSREGGFFNALIAIGMSMIMGQFNSAFVRSTTRRMQWLVRRDGSEKRRPDFPFYISLGREADQQLLNKANALLSDRSSTFSPMSPGDSVNNSFQQILMRISKQEQLSNDTDHLRDYRNRALVANSVFPCFLVAVAAFLDVQLILGFAMFAVIWQLLVRQNDLDSRIWREVYVSLLSLKTSDADSFVHESDSGCSD